MVYWYYFLFYIKKKLNNFFLEYPWDNLIEIPNLHEDFTLFFNLANKNLYSSRFYKNILIDFFLLTVVFSQVFFLNNFILSFFK